MTLLAPILEAFFTERLIGQRQASQRGSGSNGAEMVVKR
jgi:hypothetical protein